MLDFGAKRVRVLKPASSYDANIDAQLVDGEEVVDAYRWLRDGVVFTNKRIVVINVQGITGKKRDYTSIPYAKILMYSVETSGSVDTDAKIGIYMPGAGKLSLEFRGECDVNRIAKLLSKGVLG